MLVAATAAAAAAAVRALCKCAAHVLAVDCRVVGVVCEEVEVAVGIKLLFVCEKSDGVVEDENEARPTPTFALV